MCDALVCRGTGVGSVSGISSACVCGWNLQNTISPHLISAYTKQKARKAPLLTTVLHSLLTFRLLDHIPYSSVLLADVNLQRQRRDWHHLRLSILLRPQCRCRYRHQIRLREPVRSGLRAANMYRNGSTVAAISSGSTPFHQSMRTAALSPTAS